MADGESERTGWWVKGAYAPVTDEVFLGDLEVEGALPSTLSGVYMRNGANPPTGRSQHWFLGDGMLHAVRIEGGKARWYRNRYVQTTAHKNPADPLDMAAMMDRTRSAANTSIVRHAGRYLALEEGHFPYEVSGELETLGWRDFDGKLTTALTAHPKICPETGEMLAFGYQVFPPYLTYHRFDAAGRLAQSVDIPMGGATMAHDFAASRTRVVFMDLPVTFNLADAMAGKMPFKWDREYRARFGVMPRNGGVEELRWFDVQAGYVFHVLNAFDDGDRVIVDAARYDTMWATAGAFGDGPARLHRYTLDMATGAVSEQRLDDAGIEFPRLDERRAGLPYRYGYAVETGLNGEVPEMVGRLFKYDLQTGARTDASFEVGAALGEPVFAAAGSGEDEGYVMTFRYEPNGTSASLIVLDAQDMGKGPIAAVKIPRRVPLGFHGGWFSD